MKLRPLPGRPDYFINPESIAEVVYSDDTLTMVVFIGGHVKFLPLSLGATMHWLGQPQ